MNKELAAALITEAKHDLNSAKILLENLEFARSVQHSYDAVEKVSKALLTVLGHGTILDHEVSDYLIEFAVPRLEKHKTKLADMINQIIELEQFLGKTKYPRRIGKTIIIPSEQFNEEIAKQCYNSADAILNTICRILTQEFSVE